MCPLNVNKLTQVAESTDIICSAAAEFLARLYVEAHAVKGDFDRVSIGSAKPSAPLDTETRDRLLRYFGADYSLGMSLLGTVVSKEWVRIDDLIDGLAALDTTALVFELLTSTSMDTSDHESVSALVSDALVGRGGARSAARKVSKATAFTTADVEYVLSDPNQAQTELLQLLTDMRRQLPEDAMSAQQLVDYPTKITAAFADGTRHSVLSQVTGGWSVSDDAESVVLVPTESLGSMIIPRVLADGRILVAFGTTGGLHSKPTTEDIASIARALSNEQRLEILQRISKNPSSGLDLANALQITGATVHYHTSHLRSLGLITSTRDSHSIIHSLDERSLFHLLGSIAELIVGRKINFSEQ